MTITSFNRGNLPQIRADIAAALKGVAETHGIQLGFGKITFHDTNFRATVTGDVMPNTTPGTDADVDLSSVIHGNVLPENLRGRQFRAGSTLFTLSGVNSRRHKYPFTGTGPQGGQYKFTLAQVQNGLI